MSDKLVRIKNRYDTADNWISENPILAAGEIGIDSTNNIIKVGNGNDNWRDLPPYNYQKDSKFVTMLKGYEAPPIGCVMSEISIIDDYIDYTWPTLKYNIIIFVDGYMPIFFNDMQIYNDLDPTQPYPQNDDYIVKSIINSTDANDNGTNEIGLYVTKNKIYVNIMNCGDDIFSLYVLQKNINIVLIP